jgi:hypothetical protein
MDVPLKKNDIGIRHGLKGNRKPSTFSLKTDVGGLSAFSKKDSLYKGGFF